MQNLAFEHLLWELDLRRVDAVMSGVDFERIGQHLSIVKIAENFLTFLQRPYRSAQVGMARRFRNLRGIPKLLEGDPGAVGALGKVDTCGMRYRIESVVRAFDHEVFELLDMGNRGLMSFPRARGDPTPSTKPDCASLHLLDSEARAGAAGERPRREIGLALVP
jgi:hypothetical protein